MSEWGDDELEREVCLEEDSVGARHQRESEGTCSPPPSIPPPKMSWWRNAGPLYARPRAVSRS